jgi:tetratricopeptide (TPR) repeat protein
MVLRTSLLVLFLLTLESINAQKSEVTNQIYKGNQLVDNEVFDEAEMAFRKALSKSSERVEALYNLGNTHFNEQDYEEAKQRYFQTQKFTNNNSSKHYAFHNMGNVFMKQKDYAKAVEAYKNALRNNPQDEETRYNYALAKELLEKEQQQGDNQDQNQDNQNQQDQDDKEKKDQNSGENKEDNEGDEGEDEEDKKDEGDQKKDNQANEGNDEKQNQQPQQPQKTELSPEQVKSLLEAMNNQEKEVQDKVNAEKVKGTPVRGTKDW